MDNRYDDLFDLYLEDMEDQEAVPEEFILSSKVVFLSNSQTLPGKVKDHTLSFVVDKSLEESNSDIQSKIMEIVDNVFDQDPDSAIVMEALEEIRTTKGFEATIDDFIKYMIFKSANLPEQLISQWMINQ